MGATKIESEMEPLEIIDGRDPQLLWLADVDSFRRWAYLNIGYPQNGPDNWQGMLLSSDQARQVRDWLTRWLDAVSADLQIQEVPL